MAYLCILLVFIKAWHIKWLITLKQCTSIMFKTLVLGTFMLFVTLKFFFSFRLFILRDHGLTIPPLKKNEQTQVEENEHMLFALSTPNELCLVSPSEHASHAGAEKRRL